jgi:hypothetical protein
VGERGGGTNTPLPAAFRTRSPTRLRQSTPV